MFHLLSRIERLFWVEGGGNNSRSTFMKETFKYNRRVK
nr:MAG TPA: hypothetical protein [Caudoviricetes sp.]